jgi:hypothetical protein
MAFITILAFSILARVQHKSVHHEFVSIINRTIGNDITFQDFSVSYLRSFPKISIRVKEAALQHDTHEAQRIGELEIRMNLMDFWRKKEIRLNDLIIRDGSFFSTVDSLGNKTRLFNKKNADTGNVEKEAIPLEIKNIRIYNCKLHFGNEIKHNRVKILLNHAHFSLTARDSLLFLNGDASGHLDSLISNNSTLLANHPFTGDELMLKVNQISGVKELTGGHLDMHTLRLTPRFRMTPHLDGQLIEVHIDGGDSFNNLMGLVEFHSGLAVEQINPDAMLRISFNQTGFVNPFVKPYSELDFEVMSAEFAGEKLPLNIVVGKIKGNYNNGEAHSSQTAELVIDTLYAFIGESFVHGNLKLTDLNDPVIHSHLIASLDLTHLVPQTENIAVAGTIEADLQIEGKISELKDLHAKGEKKAKGLINVQNLRLLIKDQGYDLNVVNGAGLLNNHLIEVTRLVGAFNESAFHFQGKFENLDEYIIEKNKDLTGQFVLNFDLLDIRKLNFSKEKNTEQPSMNMNGLALDFLIHGKKIITDMGDFNDLKVQSRFENNELNIQSFDVAYQNGSLGGFGKILFDTQGIDSIIASIDGKFRSLTIQIPENDQEVKNEKAFNLPDFINAHIDLHVVQGNVSDIKFENLSLTTKLQGKHVNIVQMKFDAFGGSSDVAGSILLDKYGLAGLRANGTVNIDRIDLDRFIGENSNKPDQQEKKPVRIPNTMELDLKISCNKLTYKEFLVSNFSSTFQAKNDNSETKKTSSPRLIALDKFQTNTKASNFQYKNLSVDNVNLSMDYAENRLELTRLSFSFADGTAYLTGNVGTEKSGLSPGKISTNIDKIDIKQLLENFENFDQDIFTSLNTSGTISSSSHYYFVLDKDLKPTKKDNLLIANNRIHNAELDKVEPIEKTLFFVGHKAKDKMIISELDVNLIMIGNDIYFNDLFMNDNIANLDAYGKVNLDKNLMEVGIEVSLTDLLFRSKKERVAETMEGIVKLDSDAKLFLGVNGTLDDQQLKLISRKKFNNNRKKLMAETKKAEKLFLQNHK